MNNRWKAYVMGFFAATVLIFGLLSYFVSAGEQNILVSETDKASYSAGLSFVRQLKQQGGAFNLDLVIQGIRDGLTGETLMTEEVPPITMVASPPKIKQEEYPGGQVPWQELTLASTHAPDPAPDDAAEMRIVRNDLARYHAAAPSWFSLKSN